ncbi:MAG: DNA polymerase III subunit delta [Oscillospiraceae bacterium]|nr:DNA polymerase III subunit delta [Oscillospiraceae bacterium]MCI9308454.1 DNA polymerase III subunit delta [Oscillospiraceae bacterium]
MPPKRKKADNSAMRELKGDLKAGTPKPVYLFYGEEAFLRDYYLDKLKALILPDGLEDFNLHAARGKECSLDWIEQAVDCLPMMSRRTLVTVTDFDLFAQGEKGRDRLMELLGALPEYCTLVFVYDLLSPRLDGRSKLLALLKKLGGVVDFQRQDGEQLTDWICRQFKKAGKSIDTRDAGYLVFLCGDLMHDLSSEIGKIAAYCPHDRVTREDIDALAVPKVDAVAFKMTDALAGKDFDRAASVLADLLHARESPVMILSVMGKYFRQLYTARLYLDAGRTKGEYMELWGMRGGYMEQQAQRLLDAARRFSPAWCRYAVRRCAEADAAVKSAPRGQDGEVLTALLVELASGRRAAV